MPLINIETPLHDCRLITWKITESENDLIDIVTAGGREDFIPAKEFKSKKRRMEWLSTRCALLQTNHDKAVSIEYADNGKPFLASRKYHISVSHAWPLVCILEHDKHAVGIDIEFMTDRILKIADKFVNQDELNWMSSRNSLNELYLIWAAKEAVFKMKSASGVDFRTQLILSKTDIQSSGNTTIQFSKDGKQEMYNIYYRYLDNMILVYTIAFST